MKKLFYLLLCLPLFVSCGNDDEEDFNPLYQTWIMTHVDYGNGYEEFITPLKNQSFVFTKHNHFVSEGILGNESGTFKVEGNFIICYDESGYVFVQIEIIDIESKKCELMITQGNTKLKTKGVVRL